MEWLDIIQEHPGSTPTHLHGTQADLHALHR